MLSQEKEPGVTPPPPPPSSRHPRRLRAWTLAASFLTHGLVLGLAAAAALMPASKAKPERPPAPVPVVVLPPTAPPSPLPKAKGDLPVPAEATPTPAPTPTPTPRPTPKPKATPTPKPTPKATPTPTPEQRQFQTMRQIPYFKDMTDEELKKQKLPPGMTNWDEVIAMGKKLDGLNWLFLPPETGNVPQAATPAPGATPSAMPTPREEVDEEGNRTLTFQQEDQIFTARWKEGDETVTVTYVPAPPPGSSPVPSPSPSPSPGTEKTFTVPYVEDREQLLANILSGYIESLFTAPEAAP